MYITLEIPGRYGVPEKKDLSVGPKPGSRSRKITHVYDRRPIPNRGGEVDSFITAILEASKGLINPSVDIDERWGDYEVDVWVTGWRPMTPKELSIYKTQQRERRDQQKEWERREFERIKTQHPDWIKEDL